MTGDDDGHDGSMGDVGDEPEASNDGPETAGEAVDKAVEVAPDPSIVVWVLAGCLVFAGISVAAPATYHAAQPPHHYVSIQDVGVTMADDDVCTFHLATDYYARYDTVVHVETALVRVDQDANPTVQSWRGQFLLEQGVNDVSPDLTTSDPLGPGVYRFEFDVMFESPYGWQKQATAKSVEFVIHHGNASADTRNDNGTSGLGPGDHSGPVFVTHDNARCAVG